MTNVYCYCIIENADETTGTVGTVPKVTGMDGNYGLYSIPYRNLNMLVSRVSEDEFSESKLNDAIEDIAWLGRHATLHEKIVESVMNVHSPLLPMKFCTIYSEEAYIKKLLEKNYSTFTDAINYLKDKVEYGVKVYVECSAFRNKMNNSLHNQFETMDSNDSGRDYLLKRKAKKLIQENLLAEISTMIKMIHSIISEWSTESVPNKMLNIGNKTSGEIQVQNFSYLIENEYLDRFLRVIKEINNRHSHEGLKLMTSGPWPPYNFSPKIN